ncbi:hypothetical protein NIES22_48370 [Calothrix brevissima NIES-22]|nr:hypothetical protein NIES22_48370 [Calothrix brevissima NIES-22]
MILFCKKNATNSRGMALPCPLEYINVSQTLFKLVELTQIIYLVINQSVLSLKIHEDTYLGGFPDLRKVSITHFPLDRMWDEFLIELNL